MPTGASSASPLRPPDLGQHSIDTQRCGYFVRIYPDQERSKGRVSLGKARPFLQQTVVDGRVPIRLLIRRLQVRVLPGVLCPAASRRSLRYGGVDRPAVHRRGRLPRSSTEALERQWPWAAQRSDRCPKESFGVRSKTFMPEVRKTWWHGLTPARGTLRSCGCYSKDYLSRVPTRSTSCCASESVEANADGVSRARQAAGDDLPGGVAAAGRPLRGEPLFRCTRTGTVPSPPVY